MTDAELLRLERLQLTYDGWGIAIHHWAPDAIKRAVAELRTLRSVDPKGEMVGSRRQERA